MHGKARQAVAAEACAPHTPRHTKLRNPTPLFFVYSIDSSLCNSFAQELHRSRYTSYDL